jgi:hypothetical protein
VEGCEVNDNEDHIALTKRVIEHLRRSRDDDKNAEVLSRVIRGEFKRVAEEEREACAQIADDHLRTFEPYGPGNDRAQKIAAAIRARGEEDQP